MRSIRIWLVFVLWIVATQASAQDAKLIDAAKKEGSLNATKRTELNRMMRMAERDLTHPSGLPRRPWFRHLVYAPGFYTGYGVKTLPGVREAIEQKDWKEAEAEIARAAGVLEKLAGQLEIAGNNVK